MTLQWRPLTKDDVERWAELLAEVEKADRTGENYGVEDLADAAREVRNAAFTDHWGSVPHTPESWERSIVGVHAFRPEVSHLVQDGSGRSVAVLITHYYEADTRATGIREAWIQIIGTLREWRGRGVAGALLAHALAGFRERGYQRAALGVDADNPTGALGVYTRAGFETEKRATTYMRRLVGETPAG